MQVNSEVMDQKDHRPDDVLAENGLLKQLTKALLQYTLNAQSTPVRQDLGYPRFAGFDDKIVSMFARGTSEGGIRKRLDFIYGVDLSPSLISEATSVLDVQLSALRSKKLEPLYPIVYVDTIHVELSAPIATSSAPFTCPSGSTSRAASRCWGSGRAPTRMQASGRPTSTGCAIKASRIFSCSAKLSCRGSPSRFTPSIHERSFISISFR